MRWQLFNKLMLSLGYSEYGMHLRSECIVSIAQYLFWARKPVYQGGDWGHIVSSSIMMHLHRRLTNTTHSLAFTL